MQNAGMNIEDKGGDKLVLHVGPQHPGSGHFRLIITVDGDYIVGAKPDPGYVHRGAEKMAEYRDYIQNIPHLLIPLLYLQKIVDFVLANLLHAIVFLPMDFLHNLVLPEPIY